MKGMVGLVGVMVLAIIFTCWALCASAQDTAAPSTANLPPTEFGNVAPEAWTAYCQWTASLPPDQLAWEKMLQKHLGTAYFPGYLKDRLAGKITLDEPGVWGFVKDDPKLPRVLLIGASISCEYTESVRHLLKGKVNVHRAPTNCGPTDFGLSNIDDWLATPQGTRWDVIQFNFGYHDRNWPHAWSPKSPDLYAANLEKLIPRLQKIGATLIWARTEPFADSPNAKELCATLNKTADAIMAKHNIRINDMYAIVADKMDQTMLPDKVHYNPEGVKLLAEQVAKVVGETLDARKAPGGAAQSGASPKAE